MTFTYYLQVYEKDDSKWIICHNKDTAFRTISYKASKYLLVNEIDKYEKKDSNEHLIIITPEDLRKSLILSDFIKGFNEKYKENTTESSIRAMKHALEVGLFK